MHDAKAGVIGIRRIGKRNGQRPDGAGDETRAAGLVRDAVGPFAALARGLFVDFPGEVVEEFVFDDALVERRVFAAAVFARVVHEEFALADARGGKSVRLDDVRARFEKAAMNVADASRLRERVEVAVVLQVLLGILEPFAANLRLGQSVGADGRAHRAVNDDDAFAEEAFQMFGCVRGHVHVRIVLCPEDTGSLRCETRLTGKCQVRMDCQLKNQRILI